MPKGRNWGDPESVHKVELPPRREHERDNTFTEVGGRHYSVHEERLQPAEYLVTSHDYVWQVREATDGQLEVVDEPEAVDEKLPKHSSIIRAVKKHRAKQALGR